MSWTHRGLTRARSDGASGIGFTTRKEAEAALAAHLHNLENGTYVEPHRETVASFSERWLHDYARVNVTPRTYARYEEIIRRQIIPALGAIRLTALRPAHLLAAQSKWLETGRLDGRGGLSKRTVLHHHRLLREILQHAVKWQVLARNPADAVEAPRPPRTEMHTLDREQAGRLLQVIEGSEFETFIRIALQTGLRLGELLGLRWQDVDLVRGEIHIVQTLQRIRAGEAVFGQPKTHRSRRNVALSPDAIEILRQHRRQQVEERLAAGSAYANHDLVFADANGEPVNGDRLRRTFYRLLKDAGLPPLRLHDLRHTMATLMLSQHIHPKIVSERLGHATVAITLDTYSHVLPGLQDAARAFDDGLRGHVPTVSKA